jgi:hypothetical protein
MDEFRVHFWPRNEFASISGRRNRRLCRGVALPPGTPPEHGAARRNPAARGSNMLVVSSTLSFRSGSPQRLRALRPYYAGADKRNLRSWDAGAYRSCGIQSLTTDGFDIVRCWATSRSLARSSYARHRGPAVSHLSSTSFDATIR